MSSDAELLARIHDMDPAFNERHARLLRWAGAAVTGLLVVSPYSLRIAVAYGINVAFNRPAVYADIFSRTLGALLRKGLALFLYACVFPFYVLARRVSGTKRRARSWAPREASSPESCRFQF